MKQLKEMPEEGQFVAVWNFGGELWASSFKVEDDVVYEYGAGEDEWFQTAFFEHQTNLTFFVKD